jgi:hypothetical protein
MKSGTLKEEDIKTSAKYQKDFVETEEEFDPNSL